MNIKFEAMNIKFDSLNNSVNENIQTLNIKLDKVL